MNDKSREFYIFIERDRDGYYVGEVPQLKGCFRQRGGHIRLKHKDGRVVTVPVHSGKIVGDGLLIKILRDADLTKEEFIELLE